jgi:hypothetical protein
MESLQHPSKTCSTTPVDDDYLFPQENILYSAMCKTV